MSAVNGIGWCLRHRSLSSMGVHYGLPNSSKPPVVVYKRSACRMYLITVTEASLHQHNWSVQPRLINPLRRKLSTWRRCRRTLLSQHFLFNNVGRSTKIRIASAQSITVNLLPCHCAIRDYGRSTKSFKRSLLKIFEQLRRRRIFWNGIT